MRLVRYSLVLAAAALALALALATGVYLTLRSSLPQIEGELVAPHLTQQARIERDAQGAPTVRAASRADLAFATGFAHAQDRFFQMDLMRRAAAGELAQLLGASLLDADRRLRMHGFRRLAAEVVRRADEADQRLLEAYTAGVNFALSSARARPWEYLLLRSEPQPWSPQDSVLIAFSMYLDLNDSYGSEEFARAQLRDSLPPALFAFLHPFGTEWDAPVVGAGWRSPAVPGPEVMDLRAGADRQTALTAPRTPGVIEEKVYAGSNSWAVAATHAHEGAALLANDMHLGLRLPHVWYRARMVVEPAGPSPADEARDLVGVTLPGLPMLIVGSNGHVAWGFTNSYGDWTDLVVVEPDPRDPQRYLTAEGSEPFELRREVIEVRGGAPVELEVKSTRWGPIVREGAAGRPLALAWTAHDPRATNVRMIELERVRTLEEALDAANRAGAPVQNFLAADAAGRIGWTVLGQVPVRANYDSAFPASWREPGVGWTGWREPHEYPRVIDPPSGRLWTANTRTIDAETWLAFLGDGGFDLGARAAQIRDGLLALPGARAQDMLAIQLDDRALFLTRWRDLVLELLDDGAVGQDRLRREARSLIQSWSARAAADDAGYHLVRAARLRIRSDVFKSLTAQARSRFPDTQFEPSAQFEGALWRLVTERPPHLLDPRYTTWEEALLGSLDAALADLDALCGSLSACAWGRRNTLAMRHPLSAALPFASRWLDMPEQGLSGDSAMPRVQSASFGASERLVVSPGREAHGILQMPGGPVDHPLSPFYGAGHDDWAAGRPTQLLPGPPQYTLRLAPAPSERE